MTNRDFETLKELNPTLRMQLFIDTSGNDANRIIIYSLPSETTSISIIKGVLVLDGIEWQKAYYTHSYDERTRMFYKHITVIIV